ncbi:MAG: transposase [Deltaproteobacteria bacterium]|nr:transposase [Deltaproteobacteria bacterium]
MSKCCTFCIQKHNSEKVIASGEFETSGEAIKAFARKHKLSAGTRVGLETGTTTIFVARELAKAGLVPVVIDAREVRRKARRMRQKDDARDAFEICDGLRRDVYVSTVIMPEGDIQRIRDLLTLRSHFVRLRSAEVLSLKSALRKQGFGRLTIKLRNEKAFETLSKIPELSSELRDRIQSHQRMFIAANNEVVLLDKQLRELS